MQTRKKDNKETAILNAAEKLFAEKGFKGATTTLIAAEAGVTHAMLHYYFRTKDQIFLKVFDDYVEEVRSNLKAIMDPDAYDVNLIKQITEIFFDFINEHRGQISLFLEVAKERPDLIDTYVSEFGRYLSSAFSIHQERTEKAVKEGKIRSISFNDLLMDILNVCTAPFFFEPVLSNIFKMDDERKAVFLSERKKEAAELMACRLSTNVYEQ